MRAVLDTNVLVAGLRSRRGASFALLKAVRDGSLIPIISPAVILEYEDVLMRPGMTGSFPRDQVGPLLDWICSVAEHQQVFFLWRPTLKDPADEMFLEVGVAAKADALITHNSTDFEAAERFDLRVLTSQEALREITEQ